MYSIGEFSKIGSVSTKTLRYYDEIGLMHPAYVDEENHYRYYSKEQVDTILLITELKSYDLRLEQIKAIIESNDRMLLEHFLENRIQELEHQMQESIRLKKCIEKKMQQIQLGGSIMDKKNELIVEEKVFEPVLVMSKKATISMSNVSSIIGSVYEEIYKAGLRPSGSVMVFYFDEEFHQENANIEVCIPVEENEQTRKMQQTKILESRKCATCTFRGPYSKLGKAYAAVLKWISEHNYEIASTPFDIYMNNPQEVKNPEEFITQVYFPIK